jgi:DNA-binding NarL/FixJ family response regulator
MTTPPGPQPAVEPKSSPLRVIIVDDAPSTRRLLKAVIDCVPSLDVVDEADSGRTAIESAELLRPDVVLLDLALPDIDGALVLPELLRVAPGVRIVILSHTSRSAGPELVVAGATGFIEKGLTPEALVDQLSTVLGVPLTIATTLPPP